MYYEHFASGLSGKLENMTRSFPMLFTRSLSEMLTVHQDFDIIPKGLQKVIKNMPLLRSHIDQFFVSPSVKVSQLKQIHFNGSDHWGFLAELE